ncbi:MAG TPA: flagellar hook capping FlgD N-terminal domain-containing protein, partial [Gryllotalpicola sp.]
PPTRPPSAPPDSTSSPERRSPAQAEPKGTTMPIDGITGSVDQAAQAAALAANASSKKSQTMDSEVFMKLLVTQLQNQDPSSPMDTDQMISQTTQLAMMEQLTNLSTTQTEGFALQMRVAASELIGRQVSYANSDGDTVSGTVSSVSFAGAVPTVTVGNDQIQLDALTGIADPSAPADPSDPSDPSAPADPSDSSPASV